MSWVKNLWNRMFADEREEEVEPEYEAPVESANRNVPFRFPVITDEEREIFLKREQNGEKVTMAEVREELVRRPLRPAQNERREFHPEPVPVKRPVRQATQHFRERPSKPAERKEKSRPVPVKNRFEPTRIPSPIHGYNERKPARIEKLLEQKELKEEFQRAILPQPEPAPPEIQKAETEKAPAVIEQIQQESGKVTETIPVITEQEPVIEQMDAVEAEPEIREETQISSVAEETKSADLEESPVETDPAFSEEEPEPEMIEENPVHNELPQTGQPSQAAIESAPIRKKEKTVPFNVLMLKSDKEKINKFQPFQMKQQAPIKKAEPSAIPKQDQPATIEKTAPLPVAEEPVEPIETPASLSYVHPHSSFLQMPENDRKDDEWMEEQGERLIEALSHFQVQATILSIVQGPAVTQFELTVAQGVKVSKIRNLADDLKLALAAKDIRIQAPIPGKSSIGIEIPNRTSRAVRISEVLESPQFLDSDSPLEAALGLDLTGKPVTLDLRKMPHGLIAGATGSGKSVCINSLLVSLLYKSSPRDLKLLLIDPKMVELAPYNHIPHLVSPVITDVKAATASLKWAVSEMERRYQLFAHTGVRDISRYNKLVKEKGDHAQHLPYILIVIDELADLMMMSPSDVEDAICRIAQKARACGIHLVIATQRPSVDVITGLIKSNIPTRIAFSVSSQVDSRTILDSQGAERLLGRGDMLYLGNGMSAPSRIQGTFVTDEEIEKIIDHVRSQGEPEYFFKEDELIKQAGSGAEQDELFEDACRFIMQQGSASTSLLQRKFHIGYNRAARLMDLIEEYGFISEQNGSKARSVLITEEDISEVFH